MDILRSTPGPGMMGNIEDGTDMLIKNESKEAAEKAQEISVEHRDAEKSAQAEDARDIVRPKSPKTEKKTLAERTRKTDKTEKTAKAKEDGVESKAKEYEKKNPELKEKSLKQLRERIKDDDGPEEIRQKVSEYYRDPTLADDALDFLLDTTEGALKQKVAEAKNRLNEEKGREIQAGRNIAIEARIATDKGLGDPTSMRDLYRDVTGNPRDAIAMFKELRQKYDFKQMNKVVQFLLHSMGSDMKSKGPSIARGELHNLITETRVLQSILGVYRFFNERAKLINKLYNEGG